MKNLFIRSCLPAMFVLFALSSCHKKPLPVDTNTNSDSGKIKLEFFNHANGGTLNLNNQWLVNAHGDSFTVSKFNYYISNIAITGPNGAKYIETESYHLLQATDLSSMTFDLSDVPAATYDSITFLVGVDPDRNTAGAQTGALDPLNGMFWDWNSGYIMLKLEGTCPRSPSGRIELHCGGFIGQNSSVRSVKLPLSSAITVTGNGMENHVHLVAEVLTMFNTPNQIDLSTTNIITMPDSNSRKLAENYQGMFSVTYAGL